MRAFLTAINERAWQSVEYEWKHPTETNINVVTPKPQNKWTKEEIDSSSYNGKGINALFNILSQTEFSHVFTCEITKEIWNNLKVMHKGTSLVKVQKLQMLTSKFDSIRMEKYETFTEYYTYLQDIINTCMNLGEKISESKAIIKFWEIVKHLDKLKIE